MFQTAIIESPKNSILHLVSCFLRMDISSDDGTHTIEK
jgi:hypothetical protein